MPHKVMCLTGNQHISMTHGFTLTHYIARNLTSVYLVRTASNHDMIIITMVMMMMTKQLFFLMIKITRNKEDNKKSVTGTFGTTTMTTNVAIKQT